MPGRIVALDVGDVRTGIAATDPMQIIASPHSVVSESSRARAVAAVRECLEALEPVLVVVGLPLVGEGETGPQARKVQAFVELLEAETDFNFVYQDESYTTVAAEEILVAADMSRKKRKRVVDKLAAAQILQAYLDARETERGGAADGRAE